MKKIKLKKILLKLNILPIIEQINFFRQKWIHRKSNQNFKIKNPTVKLPPDFYLYETFNLNYDKFYTNGKPTAQWIINYISEFKEIQNLTIIDWGCGTGRIIRHLPSVVNNSNTLFGTDYNEKYVNWCSENLKGIQFKKNNLHPPLDFETNFANVIYGISIFTHLSENLHFTWRESYVEF